MLYGSLVSDNAEQEGLDMTTVAYICKCTMPVVPNMLAASLMTALHAAENTARLVAGAFPETRTSLQVLDQLQKEWSEHADVDEAIFHETNRQLRLMYSSHHRICYPIPLYKHLRRKSLPEPTSIRKSTVVAITEMLEPSRQIHDFEHLDNIAIQLAAEDAVYLKEQESRIVFRESTMLKQIEESITSMLIDEAVAEILLHDRVVEVEQGRQVTQTVTCSVPPAAVHTGRTAYMDDTNKTAHSMAAAQSAVTHVADQDAEGDAEAVDLGIHSVRPAQIKEAMIGPQHAEFWNQRDNVVWNMDASSPPATLSPAYGRHEISEAPVEATVPSQLQPYLEQIGASSVQRKDSSEGAEEVASSDADSEKGDADSTRSADSSPHSSAPSDTSAHQHHREAANVAGCLRRVDLHVEPIGDTADIRVVSDLDMKIVDPNGDPMDKHDVFTAQRDSLPQELPAAAEDRTLACQSEAETSIERDQAGTGDRPGLMKSLSVERHTNVVADASDVELGWDLNGEDVFTIDELRLKDATTPGAAQCQQQLGEGDSEYVWPLYLGTDSCASGYAHALSGSQIMQFSAAGITRMCQCAGRCWFFY